MKGNVSMKKRFSLKKAIPLRVTLPKAPNYSLKYALTNSWGSLQNTLTAESVLQRNMPQAGPWS